LTAHAWNSATVGIAETRKSKPLFSMPNKSNTTDNVFQLQDGRLLGYAEYGDPGGKPVFFFHGLPGSRRQRHPDNSIATELGARIIAIDRPGFGLSDFQYGRKLLDWPADVAQLADSLNIDQFAAMGVSGGGPYLLACAYKMPERITSATVISGMGPVDKPEAMKGMLPSMRLGLGIAPKVPWGFVRVALDPMAKMVSRNPTRAKKLVPTSAPEADKKAFARPEVREVDRQDLVEAYRNGAQAAFWEVITLATPWGFRLEDIHKKIHLWHGEEDTTVPHHMGRFVARTLPNCEPVFYPGEGHTLMYNYWREILTVAVS
jgi:pimeloyl-ACP methyl ester carboxylesterase